ncbi:hypothetical protein M433DRAFT_141629 [Acidomyces richmondensis BFW]|nr:MAG: hypothetical protein FE78DRAFT_76441 [Acidomyces sp. 'richmondensis']KYG47794.1 hypothetical protein M433DRAFT_141629 [Acidomyces richmondensis BFW]
MAAPPVPPTPAVSTTAPNPPTASSKPPTPPYPSNPDGGSIEQQRAALLLDINISLLQEVNALQAAGKGGATSPQQAAQLIAQGQSGDLAAPEYVDVLRRVQANIAYLAPRASGDVSKMVKGPAHMTPPAHMPQLQPKYDRLRELFPGWLGYDLRQQQQLQQQGSQSGASPRPNGMNAPGAAPTQG